MPGKGGPEAGREHVSGKGAGAWQKMGKKGEWDECRSPASGEIRGTRGTASTRGEDRQGPHVTHRGVGHGPAQKGELEGREKPSPRERKIENERPPGCTPTYPLPKCWQNLTADAPESFP